MTTTATMTAPPPASHQRYSVSDDPMPPPALPFDRTGGGAAPAARRIALLFLPLGTAGKGTGPRYAPRAGVAELVRRARLKIGCLRACGFKSRPRHPGAPQYTPRRVSAGGGRAARPAA